MFNFRNSLAALLLLTGSATVAQATVVMNTLVQLTPYTWKVTGSCTPSMGLVKLKVRLSGTTGPATTMASATGTGQCQKSGLGKSYVLDMTGKASGLWDVALKQGSAVSNIEQITVP